MLVAKSLMRSMLGGSLEGEDEDLPGHQQQDDPMDVDAAGPSQDGDPAAEPPAAPEPAPRQAVVAQRYPAFPTLPSHASFAAYY